MDITGTFYRIALLVLINAALLACSGVKRSDPFIVSEQPIELQVTGNQKFAAWIPENKPGKSTGVNLAVLALLKQSDKLIMENELEQAADKLERLLRIEPTYAPAWSRLSWIALQTDVPVRARQMAQRSNSYAKTDKDLIILNWSFIRLASQQLQDNDEVLRAERMIEQLGGV